MSERQKVGVVLSTDLRAPLRLALHLIVGTALFAALLYAAVLLSTFSADLEKRYVTPSWYHSAVGMVEIAIFVTDVALYGVMVVSESAKFIRTLWREFKDG